MRTAVPWKKRRRPKGDIDLNNTKWLAQTALLLAVAITIQLAGLPQVFTGPGINAVLLLAGLFVNPFAGVVIGILTPFGALLRGILQPVLLPALPFIVLGNAIYVLTAVSFIRRSGIDSRFRSILGVILGSAVKYAVMAGAVKFIIEVPEKVAYALTVPQFFTAVAGGAVALVIYRILRKAWPCSE